jgi:nicotinamidase-related amidase
VTVCSYGGVSLKQSASAGSRDRGRPRSDQPADAHTIPAPIEPPSATAVLVIDVQNDFVDDRGRVGLEGLDMRPLQRAVGDINRLITAARGSGARVVYIAVEHGHKVDLAPYQARYARRGMTPEDTICHEGTWGAQLYSGLLPPEQGEPQLVKHGYDAFQIPDLEGTLRQWGVHTVIVTGVVTELCVRATAMSAVEKGFFALVPREGTASLDPDSARDALDSLERWYGDVIAVDDIITAWAAGAQSRSRVTA